MNAAAMTSDKKIAKYRWEDVGIEHSQYFTGAGTAVTKWDDAFVGEGDDADEAMEDALAEAAQSDYDVSNVVKDRQMSESSPSVAEFVRANRDENDWNAHDDEPSELYYYAVLYVKS